MGVAECVSDCTLAVVMLTRLTVSTIMSTDRHSLNNTSLVYKNFIAPEEYNFEVCLFASVKNVLLYHFLKSSFSKANFEPLCYANFLNN